MPLLGDIRTWIVLFFLIRMIGITSAPIEIGHSWRQCLTAMIARNFPPLSQVFLAHLARVTCDRAHLNPSAPLFADCLASLRYPKAKEPEYA
jgi:hypothetical protein